VPVPVGGFRLMGIVNVTPDSFSDGGLFFDPGAAIAHGLELAAQGADILDIGGESTRPGAEPVSGEEELRRVLPVVEEIAAGTAVAFGARRELPTQVQISIDTSKAAVATAALKAGASLVNDVSAFRADPAMAGLLADSGAECCLMHMLGEPRTMQREPRYGDVVDEVKAFLEERLRFAVGEGVREELIMLDPGIGFGKTIAHNLTLLRRLGELTSLGRPLVVGTSRKSFLGRIVLAEAAGEIGLAAVIGPEARSAPGGKASAVGTTSVADRLAGTIATNVLALERGASVFRVHDVAPVREALAVATATLDPRWTTRTPTT
jgi:dihydropteroate synthase